MAETTAQARALEEQEDKQRMFVASQWQLMWWKFRKHKPAIVGGIIVIFLYILAIFCEFFAVEDPKTYSRLHTYAPPQRIRFLDQGRFQLRPFVYALEGVRDPVTTRISFTPNPERKYLLKFFARGAPYKMWGLWNADLHLVTIDNYDGEGTLFLLGTDKMGRDVWSRIMYGGRTSMSIGLVGVAMTFALGITIGGFSGYYGGLFDAIVQRVIEFIRSLPSIPLWMALSASLPEDWQPIRIYFAITIILSILNWTGLARVVRSQFLALREEDFVMAAKLAGASESRIVFRHLVPAFFSHIIASITVSVPTVILSETSLSFLGLGIRPPAISWGVLLQEAQNLRAVATAPWVLTPGLFVVIVVLCYQFLGDGLRDAADPYSR
ncbi:MAG: ABC transporter permease [Anaerolineae bacterium]|nr:ABC transporter permease [Anaerolineae bacterium]